MITLQGDFARIAVVVTKVEAICSTPGKRRVSKVLWRHRVPLVTIAGVGVDRAF
jgi:hypothetical protein